MPTWYLHLMDIKMNDHRSLRMPRGVRGKIVGNEVAEANLTCKWILHYIQIQFFEKRVLTTTARTRRYKEFMRISRRNIENAP